MEEVKEWKKYSPRDRLRDYLEARSLWDADQEQALLSRVKTNINASMAR